MVEDEKKRMPGESIRDLFTSSPSLVGLVTILTISKGARKFTIPTRSQSRRIAGETLSGFLDWFLSSLGFLCFS